VNNDKSKDDRGDVNIQWFPGHMARAKRKIAEDIKLVDAVAEIRDARCPASSENADISPLLASRPRLIVLSKSDLADPLYTKMWTDFLRKNGAGVLACDLKLSNGAAGFTNAARELLREKIDSNKAKGKNTTMRFMVVGIPNVGKSTLINRLAGKNAAFAADKPGVTRGRQWITAGQGIELLDTPGVLPPKLLSGIILAYTGAVRDDILDIEAVATSLMRFLAEVYPESIHVRYGISPETIPQSENPLEVLASKRGFLMAGRKRDTLRAANILLDEFRAGKLGRITLEKPPALR